MSQSTTTDSTNSSDTGAIKLVNFQDRFGCVPLAQAAQLNRADLVTFLCKNHRADPKIPGKTHN
jgi:hypothetical protein